MAIGAGGSTRPLNNGRMYITLKPQGRARRLGRPGHRAAAAASSRRSRAPGCSCRRRKTSTSAAGGAHAIPVHAAGRQHRRAQRLGAQDARQAQDVAEAARRGDRPADVRHDADLDINRDQASRFGLTPQQIDDTLYDAFGQRQVAQYFTQQNSYHVIMEILPELQGDRQPGQDLRPSRRPPASSCRSRRFASGRRSETQAAVDQPPGPVPGGHDQLQPGARSCARHGHGGDQAGRARDEPAGLADRHLPGQRAGVPGSRCSRCRC